MFEDLTMRDSKGLQVLWQRVQPAELRGVQPAELQGKKGWGQRGSGTTNGVSR